MIGLWSLRLLEVIAKTNAKLKSDFHCENTEFGLNETDTETMFYARRSWATAMFLTAITKSTETSAKTLSINHTYTFLKAGGPKCVDFFNTLPGCFLAKLKPALGDHV